MVKAVIFDMDGLLIDSEPLWRRAETKAFASVGITPTADDFRHTMGRGINEVVEYWHHKHPWKQPSQQVMADVIVDDLIALVKLEGQAMPGVQHAFEICRSHDLPMALASSSSERIISAVLTKLGIEDDFTVVYSAQHEALGKPHPGVFITTASMLGVPPSRCLVFEDAPSGVLAAKAAGMHCIAVPEPEVKSHPFIQVADAILDSLEDFEASMLKTQTD